VLVGVARLKILETSAERALVSRHLASVPRCRRQAVLRGSVPA
jgi:hypothetical protein